jgi:transcriptional regulator with PAS, ATPase and Fis domain
VGKFRLDLYYRLSEVILQIPPLRNRTEDIPSLALAFLRSASERFGKNFETLEPELVWKFQQYDWPGNVRELKNAVDRMAILYDGPVLREAWWEMPKERNSVPGFPVGVAAGGPVAAGRPFAGAGFPSRAKRLQRAKELLETRSSDLAGIAAELGIHPTTLYRWRRRNLV